MQSEFNETKKGEQEAPEGESDYAYKKVMPKKQNRRTWSVVSLALAVLSVLLFRVPWAGLILGLLAVGCAALSRKNLGYFDKLSLAGLIIGIFGIVFALSGLLLSKLLVAAIFY